MTKAEEYNRMMIAYYRNLAGLGGGRRSTSVDMDPLGISRPKPHTPPGAVNIRYGVEPTEADIKRFIAASGGNPYAKRGTAKKKGVAAAKPKTSPIKDLLKKMTADAERQQRRANRANNNRFKAVLQGRVAGRNRTLDYLQGQGQIEEQLAREGSKDNLAKIQAYLNSHSLTHSSILPAYIAKGEKDLQMILGPQRQERDRMMADADARASEGIFDFVERKTERGPDMSQIGALAAQLGQAEAFSQAAQQPRPQRPQYIPSGGYGGGGVSPIRAQQMAYATQQQFNPVAQYQRMYGGQPQQQQAPSQSWDDSLAAEAEWRRRRDNGLARNAARQQGRQERMLARRSSQEFDRTFS